MFAKRLKAEGSLSPPSLPNQLSGESDAGTRRQSTIDDTDGELFGLGRLLICIDWSTDPRSSPASAPGPKSKRSRGTRKSQLQEVSIPLTSSRASKASMDDGTEDDENEDAEGNDDPPKPPTRAAPKPATNKAKKRRSTRRR